MEKHYTDEELNRLRSMGVPESKVGYLATLPKTKANSDRWLILLILVYGAVLMGFLTFFLDAYKEWFFEIAIALNPPHWVETPFAYNGPIFHIFPLMIFSLFFVLFTALLASQNKESRWQTKIHMIANELLGRPNPAGNRLIRFVQAKPADLKRINKNLSNEEYFKAILNLKLMRAAPILVVMALTLPLFICADAFGYTAIGANGIEKNSYFTSARTLIGFDEIDRVDTGCEHKRRRRDNGNRLAGWLPYYHLIRDERTIYRFHFRTVGYVGAPPPVVLATFDRTVLQSGAEVTVNGVPVSRNTVTTDSRCTNNLRHLFGLRESIDVARTLRLSN